MADNQIKVTDALEMIAKNLGDIKIPGNVVMEVGLPIGIAINDLKECIRALRKAEKEAEEEQAIEIVDVESGIEGGGNEDGTEADPE